MNRRRFLQTATRALLAVPAVGAGCATSTPRSTRLKTRGAVVVVRDMETVDWPALAREAGYAQLNIGITLADLGDAAAAVERFDEVVRVAATLPPEKADHGLA